MHALSSSHKRVNLGFLTRESHIYEWVLLETNLLGSVFLFQKHSFVCLTTVLKWTCNSITHSSICSLKAALGPKFGIEAAVIEVSWVLLDIESFSGFSWRTRLGSADDNIIPKRVNVGVHSITPQKKHYPTHIATLQGVEPAYKQWPKQDFAQLAIPSIRSCSAVVTFSR